MTTQEKSIHSSYSAPALSGEPWESGITPAPHRSYAHLLTHGINYDVPTEKIAIGIGSGKYLTAQVPVSGRAHQLAEDIVAAVEKIGDHFVNPVNFSSIDGRFYLIEKTYTGA